MVFKPVDRAARRSTATRSGRRPTWSRRCAFAGHRRGLVAFHSSLDAAREIAGAMLGMPAETVNGEMPDAIGEIANMIAGAVPHQAGGGRTGVGDRGADRDDRIGLLDQVHRAR